MIELQSNHYGGNAYDVATRSSSNKTSNTSDCPFSSFIRHHLNIFELVHTVCIQYG